MTTALTFFILSFVGIIALIGHKLYEMSKGETRLAGLREKTDNVLNHKVIPAIKLHGGVIEKGSLKTLFKVFLSSCVSLVMHAVEKVNEMWNRFLRSLNTSAVLKNKGQVSFYLKDIARHKENI